MCTALTYNSYFGRNFDYEFSYGEKIAFTPRNYIFNLRHEGEMKTHFAMLGVAFVYDNYPLYFDGMNEKGLGIAGLAFVGNACYPKQLDVNKKNIALFEFIPYILGNYSSVKEVKEALDDINLIDTYFNDQMPNSPLHWLIADKEYSITVECTKDGLHVYDNKIGVLTNNPIFPIQMFNLNNYAYLSDKQPANTFNPDLELNNYSRGMGGLGLPGDLSSQSRFVRASFIKSHIQSDDNENSKVSAFFHLLTSVEQQKGCCEVKENEYEYTIYSSCCSLEKGIYYYTSYNRRMINAIDMYREDLDSCELKTYEILKEEEINFQN